MFPAPASGERAAYPGDEPDISSYSWEDLRGNPDTAAEQPDDRQSGDRQPGDRQPGGERLGGAGAFGGGGRSWVQAFDPGRPGVKALAAVAVVVVVVAAFLAWRARPRVDAVVSGGSGLVSLPSAAAVTGGSSAASSEVVVAVGGKVRKPGLVHLPPGARVADALAAAGGAEPGVDVAALNLARRVADGELIMVGVTPPPGTVTVPGMSSAAAPGGLLNLNAAALGDLDDLPGVGPVLAQRILDAREEMGGFKSVADLRKVDGIGDARYEQLKELVTV
ncbi:ComEA family DNA-binding protein [Actinoplanes sp. OR16]|uniref:ComEA family DNA-binding protein n=1 Tax=Actinoplanes sp. OR16 TaxID=946334 RepID=UPI000FD75431